jgi:hypothetical protein
VVDVELGLGQPRDEHLEIDHRRSLAQGLAQVPGTRPSGVSLG